jgi:hypothetical protein
MRAKMAHWTPLFSFWDRVEFLLTGSGLQSWDKVTQ